MLNKDGVKFKEALKKPWKLKNAEKGQIQIDKVFKNGDKKYQQRNIKMG